MSVKGALISFSVLHILLIIFFYLGLTHSGTFSCIVQDQFFYFSDQLSSQDAENMTLS